MSSDYYGAQAGEIADEGARPDDDYDPYLDDPDHGRAREEPDFEAIAYAEHCEEAHGGGACDCPPPDPGEWLAGTETDERAPF